MTDKQIIDGVPVQDCVFFFTDIKEEIICDLYPTCGGCKGIDCYYKQLKRKEQECDMWKNLTVDNGAVALKYQQQLDQLKEQLEAYKMEAEEGKEINAELKSENEELKTELDKFEEQIKLQNNFIDSLLKATNNSEWLDKSMLDDEVSEVIEKIELDYAQLDQLKATNEDLLNIQYKLADNNKQLRQTLAEIKEIAEPFCNACQEFEPEKKGRNCMYCNYGKILQKISEVLNEKI